MKSNIDTIFSSNNRCLNDNMLNFLKFPCKHIPHISFDFFLDTKLKKNAQQNDDLYKTKISIDFSI